MTKNALQTMQSTPLIKQGTTVNIHKNIKYTLLTRLTHSAWQSHSNFFPLVAATKSCVNSVSIQCSLESLLLSVSLLIIIHTVGMKVHECFHFFSTLFIVHTDCFLWYTQDNAHTVAFQSTNCLLAKFLYNCQAAWEEKR
jgi:hypothetical protein